MQRHGVPIHQHGLSGANSLNVGITYGDSFRELNACVAAGLDYERWRSSGYAPHIMAEILAWYDLSRVIDAHIEDAKAQEAKKQQRKAKRKGG